MTTTMHEIEKDLDIALYKLGEAIAFGTFRADHEENLREKLDELKKRQQERKTEVEK